MLVYPKTQLEALPGNVVVAIYSEGGVQSKVITINDKLEMNKWNTVIIPMSDLITGKTPEGEKIAVDMSKINQMVINVFGDYENDGDCVFYVQGIDFCIAKGVHANEITAAEENGTVTLSADVNNLTSSEAAPVIIAAAYNEDGSLAAVKMIPAAEKIAANSKGTVSGSFTLPEGTTLKAMLTESMASMKPVTKPAQ